MELSRIFICIFLFYKHYSVIAVTETLTELKLISLNVIWREKISKQLIIVNNSTISFEDIMKEIDLKIGLFVNNETEENLQDILQFKSSSAMYTFLKCEYSSYIVNLLNYFFECIKVCESLNDADNGGCSTEVVKHFISIKKYLVSMMYNLINFMKLSPNLKLTDHSLIYSMLAINLFLGNAINYLDNSRSEDLEIGIKSDIDSNKIIIAQLSSLVNSFRCKHCLVKDYYYLNDVDRKKIEITLKKNNTVKTLLEEKSSQLTDYEDIGLKNVANLEMSTYSDDMYDPKYLLLEDIISIDGYSFISTLIVRGNDCSDVWLELKTVFEEAKNSGDIKIVFDCQILLIEVIKDLFYLQFIDTSIENNYTKVKNLLNEFEEFINKMVPKNYPTSNYNSIMEVRNSLHDELHSSGVFTGISGHSQLMLCKKPVIKTWGESKNIIKVVKNISMIALVKRILQLEYFSNFVEMFGLLSYEPNTLDNYSVLPANNIRRIENNFDQEMCNDLSKLRKSLFIFHMLLSTFSKVHENALDKNSVDDEEIVSATAVLCSTLTRLYKTYTNHEKIVQIVLPLVVRLKKSHKSFNEYLILRQVSLLSINLIECFEYANCATTKHSVDMYRNQVENLKKRKTENSTVQINSISVSAFFYLLFWNNKIHLLHELKKNTIAMTNKYRSIYLMTFNKFLPNVYFEGLTKSLVLEHSLWEGRMETAETVCEIMSQGVLDYKRLGKFILFVLKLTFSNVFKQILRIFFIHDTKDIEGVSYFSIIKTDIMHIKKLPYPDFIKTYVNNVFDVCLRVFGDSVIDEDSKEKCRCAITGQLKLFDPSQFNKVKLNVDEINDLIKIYKTKVEGENLFSSSNHHNHPYYVIHTSIKAAHILLKRILKAINDNEIFSNLSFSTCLVYGT